MAAETEAARQSPDDGDIGGTGGWAGAGRTGAWADATSSEEEAAAAAEEAPAAEPSPEATGGWGAWSWWSSGWDGAQPSAAGSADGWSQPAEGAGGSGGWSRSAAGSGDPWTGGSHSSAAGSAEREPWYRPGQGTQRCSICCVAWAPARCKFNACLGCCPKQEGDIICMRHVF